MKRLVQHYRWGINKKGLFVVLLILPPNVLWALWPPALNPLGVGAASYALWEGLENIFRVFSIISSCLLIRLDRFSGEYHAWPLLIGLFLLGYYVLWVLYYLGNTASILLLGLAVLPVGAFLSTALWQKNKVAFFFVLAFGILHIALLCIKHL